MDKGGADVELGTGQVEAGRATDATRTHVIDDDGSRALLAALLAAEHEDRVDDAATDGPGGAARVVAEVKPVRVEQVDRTEVDGVRLAGGVGRLAAKGEAARSDRVDGGKVDREPDAGGRRGGVEGSAVGVEGRTADQRRLIREHGDAGHIQGAVDRTTRGIGNAVHVITDQPNGAVGDGDVAGVAF